MPAGRALGTTPPPSLLPVGPGGCGREAGRGQSAWRRPFFPPYRPASFSRFPAGLRAEGFESLSSGAVEAQPLGAASLARRSAAGSRGPICLPLPSRPRGGREAGKQGQRGSRGCRGTWPRWGGGHASEGRGRRSRSAGTAAEMRASGWQARLRPPAPSSLLTLFWSEVDPRGGLGSWGD